MQLFGIIIIILLKGVSIIDYDLIQTLEKYTINQYKMPVFFWDSFKKDSFLEIFNESSWTTFKYFTPNDTINDASDQIPNNCGGIYLFYVSSSVLPIAHKILIYIGRAKLTIHQNLRKRIKEYQKLLNDYQRPYLSLYFKKYRNYLYISYIPISNCDISELEAELIKNHMPPCNIQLPKITLGDTENAF